MNLFLDDVYGAGQIFKDGVVPEELVKSAKTYRPECIGFRPPGGVWTHVVGTDLVRNHDGTIYVLEDNLRCPSGVSYVIENREVMKRTFPQLFEGRNILWCPKPASAFAASRALDPAALHATIDRGRAALLAARDRRVRPARDEKVIASWNGLMLQALHRNIKRRTPIYGMNLGTVGFLLNTYKELGLLQRLKRARQVTLTPLRMIAVYFLL